MKITFTVKRGAIYPYKVVGAANINFVAETIDDEQALRKIYSVYVGGSKVRVENLPEFGDGNGIKKITLTIDETVQ